MNRRKLLKNLGVATGVSVFGLPTVMSVADTTRQPYGWVYKRRMLVTKVVPGFGNNVGDILSFFSVYEEGKRYGRRGEDENGLPAKKWAESCKAECDLEAAKQAKGEVEYPSSLKLIESVVFPVYVY